MQEPFLNANTILYCRHWEKTVAFYKGGLNLPVLFFNNWFVEFKLTENTRLSIADEKRSKVKSAQGIGLTLSLEVVSIETVREHLLSRGLNPGPIREHPWNARVFYLFDPEGHRIEVWQAIHDQP